MHKANPPSGRTDPDEAAHRAVLEATKGLGYKDVTLALVREVHGEILAGKAPSDILGAAIARSLRERLGE